MAIDTRHEALGARIDSLRVGFAGHQQKVLARNRAYLRVFSPDFNATLGEHDQWADPLMASDAEHFRSSYNLARPVVELWTALEMSEFPAVRWWEQFIPTPVPSLQAQENGVRQATYKAQKLVARQVATIREQTLLRHVRRTKLPVHAYKAVLRKNLYGHSWIKTVPDQIRRSFRVYSAIDPSTIYPVWSAYDEEELDAILCSYRRSVVDINRRFPDFLETSATGIELAPGTMPYQPTVEPNDDANMRYVWYEDYWVLDLDWEESVADGPVVRGRVINVERANGRIARVTEYPGWRQIPYVRWENENERDHLGFSDVGTMLPIQDSLNRFMSQQADVISGESRPKFKYRGDGDRQITFDEESIVSLDADEDIEQIQVRLDVFPTQIHGQQLGDVMARATGLPDTVWGRITAAQNSGRALATAWRSVAARMVPRTHSNSMSLDRTFGLWLDWMELYEWDHASELYAGNRDFEWAFPNQEPRDFAEVTLDAVNKLGAGIYDLATAMEKTGERSPDEMLDRVRADYMDTVIHPEKSQSFLLLTRLKNQIAIEAQQAGFAAEAAAAQLAQLAASPPGGAPGPGTVDQQQGAAQQANTQAAQQAAPQRNEGQNQGASTKFGTLVQDGKTFNRIIDQGTIGPGA